MQHPFRHEALPYSGIGQFVTSSVAMLRDGLDRDERPMLMAEPRRLEHVHDDLGADVDSITLVPTNEHGRNPSRLLTMMQSFMLAGDDRRTLALCEPALDSHRTPANAEVDVAENLLNLGALAHWPMSVMCLYDTQVLDDAATVQMRCSHPLVRGETADNADYDPERLQSLYTKPLPPPPPTAISVAVAGHHLGRMREIVHANSLASGIAPDRVDDLVLAVNEIVTNSIRHADGHCTLRIWFDGHAAVCDVADTGWLADPLIGRLAPDPARANGRGLWLAHHLCDLVQIRSSQSGTVVRLFVDC